MSKEPIIFGLNQYHNLAAKISKKLGLRLGKVSKTVFSDGEVLIYPEETVRGRDVFIIQSTCSPVNDNIMELLIFINAIKRSSAKEVNIIIPYYGYARQDRKCGAHQPVSAKMIATILESQKINRIITFDLHSPQAEGFFEIPVDNLSGLPTICKYINSKKLNNITVVSPDQGGVVRARKLANIIKSDFAIIDKQRIATNTVQVMNVLGNVKNKNCIIIDDMIDTGGTIIKAAEALKKNGANKIFLAATHPVFSGPAIERMKSSDVITEVITTDTIIIKPENHFPNLKIISIFEYLSDVIYAIINSEPLGRVFKKHTRILDK